MNKKQKQLLEFFEKGEKGEPVVFTTPNGIFLSPEAGQDFLDKKLKAQRQETIDMGDEMEMPDYQDDGIEHAHEGYFKAISDYQTLIKTLTKQK